MFLKGGVTPTGDSDTPEAFTWVFAPSPASDDLKSITLEFNESGNPYESGQVMVTQATLRFDADNDNEPALMLDLQLMGRDWVTTTFTAALTDRETEPITARGMKLFVDDAGGTIGSTQILGKLISGSVTFNPNIHFKAFAEDETGPAANKVGRGEYQVDYQMVWEFDSDTEFAKYRNSIPQDRLIRLSREGSEINDAPTNKLFQLDIFRGLTNSWSRSDREGNLTMTLGGSGFYSTDEAKLVELTIVNALGTLA